MNLGASDGVLAFQQLPEADQQGAAGIIMAMGSPAHRAGGEARGQQQVPRIAVHGRQEQHPAGPAHTC